MNAEVFVAAGVLGGIGVADAAARSWRLLIMPITTRAMWTGLIRQAAGSAVGVLLWACVCAAGMRLDRPETVRTVIGCWPLVLSVIGRMPLAGRPLLLVVHALTLLSVVSVAPAQVGTARAWAVALLGYGAFLTCRFVLAPAALMRRPSVLFTSKVRSA